VIFLPVMRIVLAGLKYRFGELPTCDEDCPCRPQALAWMTSWLQRKQSATPNTPASEPYRQIF
jgi:hypothetical protein